PRHSRAGGNPETQRSRTLSEKTETPPTVIPAKVGIQKRNATGIYRKKQKPPPRHSRAGGNPETQRNRNLSEKTETPPTVIPAKAGIQQPKNHRNLSAKTETPTDRHSRAGGNPETQRGRTLSEKTETPPTVIPAKAGIQKRNATGIYRKKQKPHRRHSRKSGNPDPSARKLTE
ncbi:TPA: hypothetical protein ACLBFB_002004, partial [Neisseria meningitidis]